MKKTKPDNLKPEALVPIKWNIPSGVMTPFATNMLVQIMENEFKLLFFELKPPIRVDESEPMPEEAMADYIGGVIVTADRLPKFIKVLQAQLDQYNNHKK